MAETVWSDLAGYHYCISCWHYDWHYYKYVYTSTSLYTPPDNKEINGSIWDDRRCMTDQNGTRDYTWTESYGESAQVAHSWQITLEIASGILGLSAGVTHQNNWSWACNTTIGTSQTQPIAFVTPYGEYGKHDVEWALEGTKYEGLWTLETYHDESKSDKCWPCSEIINTDAIVQRKERTPIATAGDWHCYSKSCDDGCGWPNMKCNGSNCGNPSCNHCTCQP